MSRRILVTIITLAIGLTRLGAQNTPMTVLDGPLLEAEDSLRQQPRPYPTLLNPIPGPMIQTLSPLFAPLNPFETKEQRAARINARTFYSLRQSVDQNLRWHRLPHYTKEEQALFFVLQLFLSAPFGYKEGYTPLMNPNNPFVYAKIPGMAPYDNPYSPEYFPQTIKTEYDFATGTYKTVMVGWEDFQKSLLVRPGGSSFGNAPIPRVEVTPGDRIVR
ncbi:MAG: hypothetical protein IKP15_06650 [Bacteroidales bacterium]|nr:hypothetical protein [Bacteroidales bacterium]